MKNIIRNKNFYLIVLLDGLLVVLANLLAYLLRFEGEIPRTELVKLYATLPYIVPSKLFVFMFFGLYRGMWRYTSLVDLFKVFKATTTSSAVIILTILFVYHFQGFPRSVFLLD